MQVCVCLHVCMCIWDACSWKSGVISFNLPTYKVMGIKLRVSGLAAGLWVSHQPDSYFWLDIFLSKADFSTPDILIPFFAYVLTSML